MLLVSTSLLSFHLLLAWSLMLHPRMWVDSVAHTRRDHWWLTRWHPIWCLRMSLQLHRILKTILYCVICIMDAWLQFTSGHSLSKFCTKDFVQRWKYENIMQVYERVWKSSVFCDTMYTRKYGRQFLVEYDYFLYWPHLLSFILCMDLDRCWQEQLPTGDNMQSQWTIRIRKVILQTSMTITCLYTTALSIRCFRLCCFQTAKFYC